MSKIIHCVLENAGCLKKTREWFSVGISDDSGIFRGYEWDDEYKTLDEAKLAIEEYKSGHKKMHRNMGFCIYSNELNRWFEPSGDMIREEILRCRMEVEHV